MLGIWFQLNLTLSDLSLRTVRVHLLMPSYRLYSKRSQQKGPLQCLLPPWGDRVHVYHITSHSPVGCAPPALGNGLSVNLSSRDSQHSERIVDRYSLSFSLSFPLPPYASFSTCPSYFFMVYERTIINLKMKMFPDKWSLIACSGLSVSMRMISMICFIFTWRWLFPSWLYQ